MVRGRSRYPSSADAFPAESPGVILPWQVVPDQPAPPRAAPATLCLRVAAQATAATVAHLRTGDGDHEVDLLTVRNDHRVVAVKCRRTTAVIDRDVRHLRRLGQAMGPDLIDNVEPTSGAFAHRHPDGIAVVPLALLGA